MLRKSLIMMALATAFTMNVNAVQIKVPEGQPPVLGPMQAFLLMHMKIIPILMKRRYKKQRHLVPKYRRPWRNLALR